MLPRLVKALRRVADALEGPPVPYEHEKRWTTPVTPDVSLFVRTLPVQPPETPDDERELPALLLGRWRAAHQARTARERAADAAAETMALPVAPWGPPTTPRVG